MSQLDKDHVLKSPTADLIKELGTDPQRGLTSADAENRLSRYGPNEVPEKRRNPLKSFAATFIGLRWFGVTPTNLQTFGFLFLLYSNTFTLLNVRERRNFWRSAPSRTMLVAMIVDIAAAAAITFHGLPGMPPLSPMAIAFALVFSAVLFLVANNFLKVQLFRRIVI
jgi:H+-transporting ATPase